LCLQEFEDEDDQQQADEPEPQSDQPMDAKTGRSLRNLRSIKQGAFLEIVPEILIAPNPEATNGPVSLAQSLSPAR